MRKSENQQIEMRTSRVQPNENVEKVKGSLQAYWNYLLRYLKKPTEAFRRAEGEFIFDVVTLALFALFIGIVNYALKSSHDSATLSFVSIVSDTFFFIAFGMLIVLISLYLINKFLGAELTLKTLTGIYGTQLIPLLALSLLTFVLILIKSVVIGNVLLLAIVLYAIFVLPLYLLTRLLATTSSNLDPHYSFISYLILFTLLFSFYLRVILDKGLGDIFGRLTF
ncbi:hypothetical protein [Filibacter tadaridae]|nr:hypothetical protein [Filibacter tadaridae]